MWLRSHFLTFLPLHAINIHHPFPVFFLSNAQFISDSVRPSKIPESKILMKIRRRSLDTWRMARSQFDKPFLKTRVLKTLTNVFLRAQKHFYRSFSCYGGLTNSKNICILLLCWRLVRVILPYFLRKQSFAFRPDQQNSWVGARELVIIKTFRLDY